MRNRITSPVCFEVVFYDHNQGLSTTKEVYIDRDMLIDTALEQLDGGPVRTYLEALPVEVYYER